MADNENNNGQLFPHQKRIILGIDPGETTGWALMSIGEDGVMRPLDYGTIPLVATNWPDNLGEIIRFLREKCYEGKDIVTDIAWELGIAAPGVPTSPQANEVRGVVQYLGGVVRSVNNVTLNGYMPTSIKASIRDKKMTKADMRKWIAGLFDLPGLKSPDMADAIAVAAHHGINVYGAKFPNPTFVATSAAARGKGSRKSGRKSILDLTVEEIRDGVKNGTLVLKGSKLAWKEKA